MDTRISFIDYTGRYAQGVERRGRLVRTDLNPISGRYVALVACDDLEWRQVDASTLRTEAAS